MFYEKLNSHCGSLISLTIVCLTIAVSPCIKPTFEMPIKKPQLIHSNYIELKDSELFILLCKTFKMIGLTLF